MILVTPEKIEEWIKEVEERPASAPLIIEFIARRLQELSRRNEELLAENISLQSGKRVEEYERRIAHLEYQLELLRRQFGGQLTSAQNQQTVNASSTLDTSSNKSTHLLIYNSPGNVLRFDLPDDLHKSGSLLAKLTGNYGESGDNIHLLPVCSSEELLFMFTSGRVAKLSVAKIAQSELGSEYNLEKALTPEEPHVDETLACISPISKLALSDFFLQVSRRGYVKKINVSMAETILANHYIGTGIKQAPDKAFSLHLANKDDRLLLVTWEGFLQCLNVRTLPVTVDEAVRLSAIDHLVASILLHEAPSIMVLSQTGKIIHVSMDEIEDATIFTTKGKPLFSAKRREMGVRVIGASIVKDGDWAVVLQENGSLTMHSVQDLIGRGAVPVDDHVLAFSTFLR